ncbi:Ubiquitin-conjugating enzyme E2 J2 [Trichoplax sp. H2]|nr:Ubiquitin-conjugating enzyme E2 J2 [Trichoplax sp. H2]|eukprot:RDD44075.1 Ubiquitin-conjugating enzyme E2 J2 [Trichoplax sp. H2]
MSPRSRLPTTATHRLRQDYLRLKKDPVPYIEATPLSSNILEWNGEKNGPCNSMIMHYVVIGPEGSPYEDGYYHGKLVFSRDYPFKPPSIYMITPNGRFKCNTRLCLSISDFHPDTWNPAWSVSTILTGLLSFMLEKTSTLGSIETADFTKRRLAWESLQYNLNDAIFRECFPDIVERIQKVLDKRKRLGLKCEYDVDFARSSNDSNSSVIANAAFVCGVVMFAYVVKQVVEAVA